MKSDPCAPINKRYIDVYELRIFNVFIFQNTEHRTLNTRAVPSSGAVR